MTKQEIRDLIEEKKSDLITLCSELLQIPSENPPGEMEAVTAYITDYLKKGGVDYTIVGQDEAHPNILASYGKADGPEVLFNGHSDVVPAGDRSQWDFDPYGGEITDKVIRGRGASDMKCGLAGALFVIRLLAEQKTELKGKVSLHVVPDEETGGHLGTQWLVDHGYAKNASCVIVAEPTSSNNCEVGQKGTFQGKVMIKGQSAHGSLGKYKGVSAIREMMKFIAGLEKLESMTGNFTEKQLPVLADSKRIAREAQGTDGVENIIDHVTVNPGTIKGGTKTNMVADYCEMEVDIRIPIGLEMDRVREEFFSIAEEQGIENISYDMKWTSGANYTDVDEPLVKTVMDNALAVWGEPIVPAYQWASSDARCYREAGIPTIQYGPANTAGIHSYNEDVDIEDVVNSAKIYGGMILDLIGSGE